MSLENEKYEFLSEHGYMNHFDRGLYFNRDSKKLFSIEAIEDHDMNWLRKSVETLNTKQTWQLYFNQPISPESIKKIINEFGE
jgi:alpha-L-fucosidase